MDELVQDLIKWMRLHESALDAKMKQKDAEFTSARGGCHARKETVKGRRTQAREEVE